MSTIEMTPTNAASFEFNRPSSVADLFSQLKARGFNQSKVARAIGVADSNLSRARTGEQVLGSEPYRKLVALAANGALPQQPSAICEVATATVATDATQIEAAPTETATQAPEPFVEAVVDSSESDTTGEVAEGAEGIERANLEGFKVLQPSKTYPVRSLAELTTEALSALASVGIDVDQLKLDAGWQRPKGQDHLWYVADSGTGRSGRPWLMVTAGNAKETGDVSTALLVYKSWESGADPLSRDDAAEIQRQTEATKQKRQEEDQARREKTRRDSQAEWDAASEDCGTHPYLVAKGVQPHGVRRSGSHLLIPVRATDGTLHGLQRIPPDGKDKRFVTGTAMTAHFHLIGDIKADGPIYLAEGYATAATIHEVTGSPVAAAFFCGNLEPVAKALRAAYRDQTIVLCADDDRHTNDNPGVRHANDAARAVGGSVVLPKFANPNSTGTDFNDLAREEGVETVREQVARASKPVSTPDSDESPLTIGEVEQLLSWSWRTNNPLPSDPEGLFTYRHQRNKQGHPKERYSMRAELVAYSNYTAPWPSIAWKHGRTEFLSAVDAYLPKREAVVEREAERTGKPPDDAPSKVLRADAEQWARRIEQMDVGDVAAKDLLVRISPPWPEPQPITVQVSPESYPLDALPRTVLLAVEEVRAFVKAPLPLIASSALSALSLAIQGHYDIKRAEKLTGPVSLDLLSIGDSGERKTTVDGFFTAAIRAHETKETEAAKPELKRYAANMASWKSKQEGVLAATRDAAKKAKNTDELDAEMERLQLDEPEAPRVPKLLMGDETPENLAWSLAKNWPSSGVISSEAGLIFGAHGMGKDSIMRNLALLNILWDGGTHSVGRRTSESFVVKGARLTVALQIQETTLRSFFDRAGGLARGTGFLARFLLAWPESTQGYRPFTEAPDAWPHLALFNRRLTDILEQPVPLTEEGTLEPVMLTLSPEAKAAWIAFHNAIEGELKAGGELYDVRDVASKTADNAVRIAALFHIFEGGIGPVSLDAFEGASQIAAWHLTEARRFFGEIAIPEEMVDAAKLDAWIIEHCCRHRSDSIDKRYVRQHGPLRDGTRLAAALTELVEMDRLRIEKDGRKTILSLNPALCEGGL
jgi:putative DNA primase/helicase